MIKKYKGLSLAVGLGLALGVAPLTAHANYPDKTVTIVVNYPAGGLLDLVARTVGEYASKKIGQPVIVENKPGAAGGIGGQYVARQKPDGYNLLLTVDTLYTVNPYVYKSMQFSPTEDLRPISLAGSFNQVLLVNPSLKINSFDEFLVQAKEKDFSYSSAGIAAPGHLVMEMFGQRSGLDLLHVPYKGNAPATQALLTGEVDTGFLAVGAAFQYVDSGKFIPLAISGTERDPRMPSVPTMQETGIESLADFDVEFGYVLMAPEKTDQDIIDFWSDLIQEALADPEIKERFSALNLAPTSSTPEEAKQYLDRIALQWKEVVKTADISID